jgi:hypothetical protein
MSFIFRPIYTPDVYSTDSFIVRNKKLRTIIRTEIFDYIVCDVVRPDKFFMVENRVTYLARLEHAETQLLCEMHDIAAELIHPPTITLELEQAVLERSGLAEKRRQLLCAETWSAALFKADLISGAVILLQLY